MEPEGGPDAFNARAKAPRDGWHGVRGSGHRCLLRAAWAPRRLSGYRCRPHAGLKQGQLPFEEPGLAPVVAKTVAEGRLSFTTSYAEAIAARDFVFLCVDTPALPDGRMDTARVGAAGSRGVAPEP